MRLPPLLKRGDTVQVIMPKPYPKYQIICSSKSQDVCYESVNGRTNERQGDCNIAHTPRSGNIIPLGSLLHQKRIHRFQGTQDRSISTFYVMVTSRMDPADNQPTYMKKPRTIWQNFHTNFQY